MGKNKEWKDLDFFQKQEFTRELGNRLGKDYNTKRSHRPGMPTGSSDPNRSDWEVHQDIQKDMSNNYAAQDYMKYSGWKNSEGSDTIQGMADIYKLEKDMKKAGKKAGVKNWNSANDGLTVAREAFKTNRKDFRQSILDSMPKPEDTDSTEEDTTPKLQSWNEAQESGNLSSGVQDALDRLNNNDYMFKLKKATDNTPTETPATQAQNFLKDSVKGVASDKNAIRTAKAKEQTYNGMFNMGSIMNKFMSGTPTSEAGQAAQLAAQGNVLNNYMSGMMAKSLSAQQHAQSLDMMAATLGAQGASNMAQNQHTAALNMAML